MSAYAKQLTLLGRLHAQARAEPVERALDDTRRSALLTLTQDLFDASLRARRIPIGEEGSLLQQGGGSLASLRAALLRQDEALGSSLENAARTLRGAAPVLDSALDDARVAVEAAVDELRGRRDIPRSMGARRTDEFLSLLDSRRQRAARQLAVEAWLADWRRGTELRETRSVSSDASA